MNLYYTMVLQKSIKVGTNCLHQDALPVTQIVFKIEESIHTCILTIRMCSI